jgi:mannose-1-phosphate guanylyltransferase
MKTIPFVLAGGKGERFWPLSRSSRPKQLLNLTGEKTMIEETLDRVKKVCPAGVKPLLITSTDCVGGIRHVLGKRFNGDVIVEPQGKNTAPAVGCAAAWIRKKYGEAVMLVVSADHAIAPVGSYVKAVRDAVDCAQTTGSLVVFGIRPTRPDTGYGYIHLGKKLPSRHGIQRFAVERFVEKPSLPVARRYLSSGNYLWNSGMFVWKVSTIMEEFRRHMPALYEQIVSLEKSGFSRKALSAYYGACAKESIDYGILEQSSRIAVVCGTFFWDDIGSWESMVRVHKSNKAGTVAVGSGLFERGSKNSIIYNSSDRVVASIGLDDTVLVATPDAVLAIARPLLPDLKRFLTLMKENGFPKELF